MGTKYTSISIDADRKKVNKAPAQMLRCFTTRPGSVAVSGIMIWTTVKAIIRAANIANSGMMRQLLQGYVEPPHCRARRRQTTPGRKNSVPSGSSRLICVQTLAGTRFCSGGCQKKIMKTIVKPPTGRLM